MKNKELKNIAKQIAKLEKEASATTDLDQKSKIEKEMMTIMSKVTSLEDMMIIDEMVMEML